MLRQSWKDGTAMEAFKVMLKSHHVNEQIIESLCKEPTSVLPQAKHHTPLTAKESGYIESIDGMAVALLGLKMKAGRAKVGDVIDPAVGVELLKQPGDSLRLEKRGASHHNDALDNSWPEMQAEFIKVSQSKQPTTSRVIKVITAQR